MQRGLEQHSSTKGKRGKVGKREKEEERVLLGTFLQEQ